jgi:predicted secreted protein
LKGENVANYVTGELAYLEVKTVADVEATEPLAAAMINVKGTSAGLTIGSRDITVTEFGSGAASQWENGVIAGQNWSIPVTANYKPGDTGYEEIETAALAKSVLWVNYFPLGKTAGDPKFSGHAQVADLTIQGPADGIVSASYTLKGRGELSKSEVSA